MIEVLRDGQIIVNRYVDVLRQARTRYDYYTDVQSLSIPFSAPVKNELDLAVKNRGVKLRVITDIASRENIPLCKKAMDVTELRHLEGVEGNFVVSDTECISTSVRLPVQNMVALDKERIAVEESAAAAAKTTNLRASFQHAVYSNVKEDILQQQHIFEILWAKALPAAERIREIEEGLERVETVALKNSAEIAKRIRKNIESSTELKVCSQPGGLELIYNNFFESYKELLYYR